MAEAGAKVRLFVEAPLGTGAEVALDRDRSHYLFSVMRLGEGAGVRVFNGRDGEWLAEVAAAGRQGRLRVVEQTGPQRQAPDLWLLFAPLKKARTDFVVEKATELGVARIRPVFTRYTNAERLRVDRLRRLAIEAAEQCGETHLPAIEAPERLDRVLEGWQPGRRLMFCDESLSARPAGEALAAAGQEAAGQGAAGQGAAGQGVPWAVLIGPEGGFAPEEAERLRRLPFVVPVTLGPRILRADTAAAAALALWQSSLGDWR